jgi:HSP20 family protein
MERHKRKMLTDVEQSDGHFSRLMRNLSVHSALSMHSAGGWLPATDIYETDRDFLIYLDAAGIEPDKISITIEPSKIIIAGERRFPVLENTCCIHQLEIDHGRFQRTIALPSDVDPDNAITEFSNGFLVIKTLKI